MSGVGSVPGAILLVLSTLAGCGSGGSRTESFRSSSGREWTYVGKAMVGSYADADAVEVSPGVWRIYAGVIPEQSASLNIFSATSSDGSAWSADAGTRMTNATFPDALRLADGTWRMYFQGVGEIVSARSTDGLAFQRESGVRIAKGNGWDQVAAPTTVRRPDGTFLMVYRALVEQPYSDESMNPATMVLLSATSTDGLSFTPGAMLVDARNRRYFGSIDGPDFAVMDDGKLHLFFWTPAGKNNQQEAGIYEMVSDEFGQTWNTPELVVSASYEVSQTGQGWGDPTFAKINGTWHMYFGQRDGIHEAVLK